MVIFRGDLTDRLRDRAYSGKGVDRLCEEAAEEIDRLRIVIDTYAHTAAAACREIASLRASSKPPEAELHPGRTWTAQTDSSLYSASQRPQN